MKVLLSPHVSEKSMRGTEKNLQYAFKVIPDATKIEIKRAVEKLFSVVVNAVSVMNVKGKPSASSRRHSGRRKSWKKAYVSLAEGHHIDWTAGQAKAKAKG